MNDEMKDFLKQKANYAVVVNCDLETIDRIKRFFADEDIRVIYQKASLGKLLVREEKRE